MCASYEIIKSTAYEPVILKWLKVKHNAPHSTNAPGLARHVCYHYGLLQSNQYLVDKFSRVRINFASASEAEVGSMDYGPVILVEATDFNTVA